MMLAGAVTKSQNGHQGYRRSAGIVERIIHGGAKLLEFPEWR